MEPVKGGNLANPPKEVRELFRKANPTASPASWAIRFAASLDGILTVLSGMSNLAQVRDNLSFMREFQPLSEEEQRVIHQAQRILGHSNTIPCTTCHYCTKGCPKQIPIPEIFTAMNQRLGSGQLAESVESYRAATAEGGKASGCIACRQCEKACPQHIPIVTRLKECAAALEG